MKFKPYEEYKEVDLPWLDRLPSHWEVVKNRELWKERNERGFIDKELISVTINNGVIKQKDLLRNTSKRDTSNLDKSRYKLIKENDIVYNTMRMWQGAAGISSYEGIVSPAYIVIQPLHSYNYKYYHYLLRTDMYKSESYRNSYGIHDDQLKLRYEDFKVMLNVLPPKEEQDKIINFLDENLEKIDQFIELRERQIELFQEEKEVIINDAVTKGIDSTVEYKDSGIDWIGEIPEHWGVSRLKTVTSIIKTGGTPKEFNDKHLSPNGLNWYSPGDFNDNLILDNAKRRLSEEGQELVNVFPENSVLIVGIGGTLGKVGLAQKKFSCNQQINVITPQLKLLEPKYLLLFLYTCRKIIAGKVNYTTLPILNQDETKNLIINFPPLLEQKEIVAHIEKETNKIDRTIKLYKNQIELIKEYRTSLIASAVTGKIDLRDF